MLKEMCLDRFHMMVADAEKENNPVKRAIMIPRIKGFLEGIFWSNVVDSDEYMKLNEKINSLYYK